jgi:hypothetical protein
LLSSHDSGEYRLVPVQLTQMRLLDFSRRILPPANSAAAAREFESLRSRFRAGRV